MGSTLAGFTEGFTVTMLESDAYIMFWEVRDAAQRNTFTHIILAVAMGYWYPRA